MKARVCAILVLATILACGSTSGPVEIPAEDLPFEVARAATPVVTSGPARTFTIYFSRGERLVPVRRRVQTDVPSAEAALRGLLDGPTPNERRRGITSQLPAAVRLLDLTVGDGLAAVDLSAEFQEPAPPQLIALRVAQVVWTLSEFPEIGAIRFFIDGEEIALTTADGTAVDRPVTREDYVPPAPA